MSILPSLLFTRRLSVLRRVGCQRKYTHFFENANFLREEGGRGAQGRPTHRRRTKATRHGLRSVAKGGTAKRPCATDARGHARGGAGAQSERAPRAERSKRKRGHTHPPPGSERKASGGEGGRGEGTGAKHTHETTRGDGREATPRAGSKPAPTRAIAEPTTLNGEEARTARERPPRKTR